MSRKKCRLSPEELNMHEQAVKLRKMTDRQLVACFAAEKKAAYEDGEFQGKREVLKHQRPSNQVIGDTGVKAFLEDIQSVSGIGTVTMKKLHNLAEERGYLGV
ncbi:MULTISPECIES: hypothetical protein [Caproicibacterium]|uniref:Uncharacterized protein n=1 Tax=Caproicibacterium argilliputei TaxID=3030016 RepID=A0AA97DDC6_9FIRM|nr:hypothetical protein [Caproicibacterium argilliputei]WOC33445.1 hypothetical protein PXC00_06155 [Caproicibacterium argilliputei]